LEEIGGKFNDTVEILFEDAIARDVEAEKHESTDATPRVESA
jgi:hypothetical protein